MNTRMWQHILACVVNLTMLSACNFDSGGGSTSSAGTIQIESTSYDSTEGTIVNIRVTRSGGSKGAASVDFTTASGSAVGGQDYTTASGTLTWPGGVSGNRTISIPIADDSVAEALESFTLTLSNISGSTLGANSSATIDIIDNDAAAVSALGTISALGSATVNGVRYNTNATTVTINGQPALAADLRLGQLVSVTGDVNFSNATGTASAIDYAATIIGPVENIDATRRHLIVLGQNVFTNADTAFDSSIDPTTFTGLAAGDTVEISGFRNAAGELIATRLAPDATSSGVQLIGVVAELDDTYFSIDRLTVDYHSADLPDGAPANGQPVMVRGTLTDGYLNASKITKVTTTSAAPGERVLLSGLVTRFNSSGDFDLNGLPVAANANTQYFDGVESDLATNVDITLDGEISSGGDTVLANQIYFDGLVTPRTTLTFPNIDNFTNITASGFLRLTVTQGADFSVEAMVNSDSSDDVEITQNGDTVTIQDSSSSAGFHIGEVFVTLPVLNRIDIAADSLANVTVRNFDQAQMEVNVDGVSVLRGEALTIGTLTASVSGVSALQFGNINPIGNANVDINGVSHVYLNMDTSTSISGSVQTGQGTGHSILYYYGTNVNTDGVTADGQSEVVRLGDTKP